MTRYAVASLRRSQRLLRTYPRTMLIALSLLVLSGTRHVVNARIVSSLHNEAMLEAVAASSYACSSSFAPSDAPPSEGNPSSSWWSSSSWESSGGGGGGGGWSSSSGSGSSSSYQINAIPRNGRPFHRTAIRT